MKREILCVPCGKSSARLFGAKLLDVNDTPTIVDPYPGEHAKFVKGVLKHDCLCDGCAFIKPLNKGDEVYAVSLWADHSRTPYYPWEDEFLD